MEEVTEHVVGASLLKLQDVMMERSPEVQEEGGLRVDLG